MTFLEGRDEAGRMDDVAAGLDAKVGPRDLAGGARSVEAREGGVLRVLESFGRGRRAVGRGGGGIKREEPCETR